MRYAEAKNLKEGDLVIIDGRNKTLGGLILEIESIEPDGYYAYRLTLKQPGFNGGFRIKDYDSRHLKRYDSY